MDISEYVDGILTDPVLFGTIGLFFGGSVLFIVIAAIKRVEHQRESISHENINKKSNDIYRVKGYSDEKAIVQLKIGHNAKTDALKQELVLDVVKDTVATVIETIEDFDEEESVTLIEFQIRLIDNLASKKESERLLFTKHSFKSLSDLEQVTRADVVDASKSHSKLFYSRYLQSQQER